MRRVTRRPVWIWLFLAACSGPEANLASADPYERFLGVRELEGRRDAAGISEIVERLQDPHYLVVAGAIQTLAELREKDFLQHIAPLTAHPHPIVRRRACDGLFLIGNPAGVPFLLKAMEDVDPQVRRGAVQSLGGFKTVPEAVRGVLAAMGDKDPGVVLLAHQKLEKITGRTDVARTKEAWAEILK